MTDIDALVADLQAVVSVLHDERLVVSANTVAQAVTALTTERAKVSALEAEAKDAREMFEGLVRTHTDNVREYDKLKETHADHVDYLCRDQADLRDKLSDAKAEAARWREVARECAGALDETLEIARDFVPVPLKATCFKRAYDALARFELESGQ